MPTAPESAELEPVVLDVKEVPLRDLASAVKAVKFLGPSATALTAKTMPAPQWDAPVGSCCCRC